MQRLQGVACSLSLRQHPGITAPPGARGSSPHVVHMAPTRDEPPSEGNEQALQPLLVISGGLESRLKLKVLHWDPLFLFPPERRSLLETFWLSQGVSLPFLADPRPRPGV